jgi:hypothetical protein
LSTCGGIVRIRWKEIWKSGTGGPDLGCDFVGEYTNKQIHK